MPLSQGLSIRPNPRSFTTPTIPCARSSPEKVENKTIAFGVSEDMHLAQNTVADAQMCQRCSGMFTYDYRQYGQLGTYHCENCGFARPELDVHAHNVTFDGGITYAITDTIDSTRPPCASRVRSLHGLQHTCSMDLRA